MWRHERANLMPDRQKRRIMRKLRIDEISGVDVPAQAGARNLIMKRRDGGAPPIKKDDVVAVVTGVIEGHQHGIQIRVYDGSLSVSVQYALAEGDEAPP